jgi:Spy/CpxP family protein refolding chaperone
MEKNALTTSIIYSAISAIMAASLAMPRVVAAQGAPEPGNSGHTYGIGDDVLAQLNLTNDQERQVQGLRADLERDLQMLYGERRPLVIAFQQELTSWNPDSGELRRLHNKLARVLSKIDERGFDFLVALIDTLNEQQRRDLVAALNGRRRAASDRPDQPGDTTGSPPPSDDPGSQSSPPPPPGGKKPPSGGSPPRGDGPGHQAPPPAPKTACSVGMIANPWGGGHSRPKRSHV